MTTPNHGYSGSAGYPNQPQQPPPQQHQHQHQQQQQSYYTTTTNTSSSSSSSSYPPQPQYPQSYHPPPSQPQWPTTPQQQHYYPPLTTTPSYPPTPGYPSTPSRPPHPPEVSHLLISLGETYISSAHSLAPTLALSSTSPNFTSSDPTSTDLEAYHTLLATGLGCLDAAVAYRLPPKTEALTRLRYAEILWEETENWGIAEEGLNKGILLAARNGMVEVKYRMQHLLARIVWKSNPKAGLKLVEAAVGESETLDIPLWTYTFRFLRFEFQNDRTSPGYDPHGAITTLQKIFTFASGRRDMVMSMLVAILEALLLLQTSGVEGIEMAQRALSNAAGILNSGVQGIPPQFEVLMLMLDVMILTMMTKTVQITERLRRLHGMLDEESRWALWRDDGTFTVPINHGSSRIGTSTPGGWGSQQPDTLPLTFHWLDKRDVFSLGYFLTGLGKFQRNAEENGKAEKYLNEGIKSVFQLDTSKSNTSSSPPSLPALTAHLVWKKRLQAYMLLARAFLYAIRTDWDRAIADLGTLDTLTASLPPAPIPDELSNLTLYLRATIAHGTGDLASAHTHYTTLLPLCAPNSDLALITTLNIILLVRPSDPATAQYLLSSVEKQCAQHKNENIKASYILVKATEHPGHDLLSGSAATAGGPGQAGLDGAPGLVKMKNYLSLALRHATVATNQQLTYVILGFMYARFFRGVVSEQAEKSAKAALQNAKKGRDSLWGLVAGVGYADCLARKGNHEEAEAQRRMNEEVAEAVAKNLLRHQKPEDQAPPPGQQDGTGWGGGGVQYEVYPSG